MSPNVIRNGVTDKNKNKQNTFKNDTDKRIKLLPEKKFEIRNSLLTDLFENPHIQTIQHIFIASLVGLFINTVAYDYFRNGEVKLGFTLIISGFRGLHITFLSLIGYNLLTCCCYMSFNFWANLRVNFPPKTQNVKVWDFLCLFSLLGYYVVSFRMASVIITSFQIPPVSSVILTLEQTRLLMKVHAFVRSNCPKVLKHKVHSDKDLKLPGFKHFLYFLYAPTLVYRDEYPMTKEVRWKFATTRLLEVVGVVFYYSFMMERFLLPDYKDFGLRKFTWSEIFLTLLENSVLGALFLLCGFYMILHSVQNLFAELLRFGDRLFYKDWWTCTDYSRYFRTWNVVVHDWLYQYVYKDMYELVVPGQKVIAKFVVFLVSAVVHEWVITYMFGFFFPALFIQFLFAGIVLSFMQMPRLPVSNILFWYFLALGAGSLVSLYTLEYFARVNVPVNNLTMIDFFLPRCLTCKCID